MSNMDYVSAVDLLHDVKAGFTEVKDALKKLGIKKTANFSSLKRGDKFSWADTHYDHKGLCMVICPLHPDGYIQLSDYAPHIKTAWTPLEGEKVGAIYRPDKPNDLVYLED